MKKSRIKIEIVFGILFLLGTLIFVTYAYRNDIKNEKVNEKNLIKVAAPLSIGENSSTALTKDGLKAKLDRYLGSDKTKIEQMSGKLKVTYLETGRSYVIDMTSGKLDDSSYTLSFNANGGSVSTASKDITFGVAYGTLPTPSKAGNTFLGWYTELSGGVKVDDTTICDQTNDITLYARWEINSYTVYFNINGGTSLSTNSKTVNYGDKFGTLPVPTRTNGIFLGWFTQSTDGTKVTEDTIYTTLNDITLYAHWYVGEWNFAYKGSAESWTAPATGKYDVVLNGASGAVSKDSIDNLGTYPGRSSAGGRVKLQIYVKEGTTLYIVVGGGGGSGGWAGSFYNGFSLGGYNGGGSGGIGPNRISQTYYSYFAAGGGGGATTIATSLAGTDGQLKNYVNATNASKYFLGVAGGGGASNFGNIYYDLNRDSRGGETGYLSNNFGYGESGADFHNYTCNVENPNSIEGSGGGGRRLVCRKIIYRGISKF